MLRIIFKKFKSISYNENEKNCSNLIKYHFLYALYIKYFN